MIRQIFSSTRIHQPYFSNLVRRPLSQVFLSRVNPNLILPCLSRNLWVNQHRLLGIRSFNTNSGEYRKSNEIFQSNFPNICGTHLSRNYSTSQNKELAHLLSPKVDIVFKDFFGDRGSKEILESFINLFLDLHGNDEIEIEEFLDPRKMRVEAGKPTTFVDLSVKTKGGERYIIEMQTYNHEGFDKRLLYYLGKDYTEQLTYDMEKLKQSEKTKKHQISWHALPKVHVIAITSYGILKSDGVVETFRFQPQKSESNGHLFDQWRATIIDLTKFTTRSFDKLQSEQDQWLFLMKSADKLNNQQVETMKNQRPILKRALERLERISSDPKKRKEYEQSINEIRDWNAVLDYRDEASREEGRVEGRIEGERNKAFKIAENLIELGVPIGKIVKSTGLFEEEVEAIKNKRQT